MDNKQQTYRRRRGDRRDGRLLRSLDPFYRFTPFIMKTRGDASNYFKDRADIAAMGQTVPGHGLQGGDTDARLV